MIRLEVAIDEARAEDDAAAEFMLDAADDLVLVSSLRTAGDDGRTVLYGENFDPGM